MICGEEANITLSIDANADTINLVVICIELESTILYDHRNEVGSIKPGVQHGGLPC